MSEMIKREKISLLLTLKGELGEDVFDKLETLAKEYYDALQAQLKPEERGVESLEVFTERYVEVTKRYAAKEYTLRLKTFSHKDLDAQIAYYLSGADKKEHSIAEKMREINDGWRREVYSPYFETSAFTRHTCGGCQGDGGCGCGHGDKE